MRLTYAVVSVGGTDAVETVRAGGQAHSDLPHAVPLQVNKKFGFARQTAIVNRAGLTASLAPLCGTNISFTLESEENEFKQNDQLALRKCN